MLARAYAPMQYINNFFRVCLVWAHAKRIIVYVWKILIDVVVVYGVLHYKDMGAGKKESHL